MVQYILPSCMGDFTILAYYLFRRRKLQIIKHHEADSNMRTWWSLLTHGNPIVRHSSKSKKPILELFLAVFSLQVRNI